MKEIILKEIEKTKDEMKRVDLKVLFSLCAFILIVLLALFAIFFGKITGYQTFQSYQTFETENVFVGKSNDDAISFEKIPNMLIKEGKPVRFNVKANSKDVFFSDDSNLFNITQEGVVEFIPQKEDIGQHNAWIIIKDFQKRYYYQNVVIIVEE